MDKEFRYAHDYTVDYMDINEDLTTSFPRLMNYVQETSLFHSMHAGYPMAWFRDNSVGFILTSWHVSVSRYPKWGERIKITTWPSMFKGILAERAFQVEDEDGKIILLAQSGWVYTDLERRRPLRVSEEMKAGYGAVFPPALDGGLKVPGIPEGFVLEVSERYRVRRSDIDSNHHVNNIRYIQWLLDTVPERLSAAGRIQHLRVVYKKECRIGDTVRIDIYGSNERPALLYANVLTGEGENQQIHAVIEGQWGNF